MSNFTYLLWSNKHDAWWKPGGVGYTDDVSKAGRYTYGDAMMHVSESAFGGRIETATIMICAPENYAPLPESTTAAIKTTDPLTFIVSVDMTCLPILRCAACNEPVLAPHPSERRVIVSPDTLVRHLRAHAMLCDGRPGKAQLREVSDGSGD